MHVRAILERHAAVGGAPRAAPSDPNALHTPDDLVRHLELVAARDGPDAVRRLGAAYVDLWARTFPTLVRHLRGRPRDALNLFVRDVYPYLRGDEGAARIEARRGTAHTVFLQGGLPDAYRSGMLAAFVGLSGAHVRVTADGDRFEVATHIAPHHVLASATRTLAALRVPLVIATLLGVVVAASHAAASPLRIALVALGVAAAQGGANALHELRRRGRNPLEPGPAPVWWRLQLVSAYGTAIGVGIYLTIVSTPLVLSFAAAGLAVALLYDRLRSKGLGPLTAFLTYGPIVTLGSLIALSWPAPWFDVAIASIPLGALAAATVYLDDVADRPLDEAAGRRTLAVRLPRGRQVVVYAFLVCGASAFLITMAPAWVLAAVAIPLLLAGAALAWRLRRDIREPHALAPVRVGTLALHLTAAVYLALLAGVRP